MYQLMHHRVILCMALGLMVLPLVSLAAPPNDPEDLLGGYPRYSEPKLQNWIATNQRVRDHGGWQNYAMEPYQDDSSAEKSADKSPDATPKATEPMKMHMHGGHHE